MSEGNLYYRMLESFEAKYGGFYELLQQYPADNEAESKRLERLMRHHDKLIHAVMGYQKGFEDGLKAARSS